MRSLYIALVTSCLMLLVASCKKDDGPGVLYTVPETYSFFDSQGNNTVNFQGQFDRTRHLSQMLAYIMGGTNGSPLARQKLQEMFENTNGDANGEFNFSSTKNLKSKCFIPTVAQIESYFDALIAAASSPLPAADGRPGRAVSGNQVIFLDENGFDIMQQIDKGIMGAVFYYQAMSVYLEDEKQSAQNDTAVDADDGKYYTDLEHHWDEAFGYLNAPIDFRSSWPDDQSDDLWFWSASCNQVDQVILGMTDDIMIPFRTGRAAISGSDLPLRDEQLPLVKENWEKLIAAAAIHHLNRALGNFSAGIFRSHHLTQASVYTQALAYNSTSTISNNSIAEIRTLIGVNLYQTRKSEVQTAKQLLSDHFSLGEYQDEL